MTNPQVVETGQLSHVMLWFKERQAGRYDAKLAPFARKINNIRGFIRCDVICWEKRTSTWAL